MLSNRADSRSIRPVCSHILRCARFVAARAASSLELGTSMPRSVRGVYNKCIPERLMVLTASTVLVVLGESVACGASDASTFA
jgi:hypothetical protein